MIERYTLPEMGALWTDQSKYETWLEVEVEAARAMAELKMIPASAFKIIARKAAFSTDRVNKIEAEVNHDVIAFLTAVSEKVGPASRYLHYGMTSSDVLDTALSLQMKRAAAIIDAKVVIALGEIKRLAVKYKMTPCIGRTHGVLAEPTTAGLKFAVWYTELTRRREMLARATKTISVGCISGAVGNFANLDPKVEEKVCKRLGLTPAAVSTQVLQRDRHAEFITALSLLTSSLEKFATEIRNLQRTEIGEMMEGFSKKQKGSSAMPHKRNPITAERISGIARLLRGYAVSAMENVTLWHERDIAHSSVERVMRPMSASRWAEESRNRLVNRNGSKNRAVASRQPSGRPRARPLAMLPPSSRASASPPPTDEHAKASAQVGGACQTRMVGSTAQASRPAMTASITASPMAEARVPEASATA